MKLFFFLNYCDQKMILNENFFILIHVRLMINKKKIDIAIFKQYLSWNNLFSGVAVRENTPTDDEDSGSSNVDGNDCGSGNTSKLQQPAATAASNQVAVIKHSSSSGK